MENDKDAYVSEYGPFTVSIKVWIVSRALLVLSHEFGHVKYQVPNLASYLEFHRMHYWDNGMSTFIGHNPNDPSGQSANHFGNIFRRTYWKFLKTGNDKAQTPSVLLAKIKGVWATGTLRLSERVGLLLIEYDRFSICTNRRPRLTIVVFCFESSRISPPRHRVHKDCTERSSPLWNFVFLVSLWWI